MPLRYTYYSDSPSPVTAEHWPYLAKELQKARKELQKARKKMTNLTLMERYKKLSRALYAVQADCSSSRHRVVGVLLCETDFDCLIEYCREFHGFEFPSFDRDAGFTYLGMQIRYGYLLAEDEGLVVYVQEKD